MARHALVALVVAGIVLAGCSGPGRIELPGIPSVSCGGMSSGACEEQGGLVAARHRGATAVSLDCSVASCGRKGGSGTAVVTRADGSTVVDSFAYAGAPGPVPEPLCIGLEASLCRSEAASAVEEIPPSKGIVRIEMRCTAASCTPDTGEAEIMVMLNDGTFYGSGIGWQALE